MVSTLMVLKNALTICA